MYLKVRPYYFRKKELIKYKTKKLIKKDTNKQGKIYQQNKNKNQTKNTNHVDYRKQNIHTYCYAYYR